MSADAGVKSPRDVISKPWVGLLNALRKKDAIELEGNVHLVTNIKQGGLVHRLQKERDTYLGNEGEVAVVGELVALPPTSGSRKHRRGRHASQLSYVADALRAVGLPPLRPSKSTWTSPTGSRTERGDRQGLVS